jgi:hypothetical protein
VSHGAATKEAGQSTTNPLARHHEQMLAVESRISTAVMADRGYATIYDPEVVAEMGFADFQVRTPALVVPVWDVFGELRFRRIRPDDPRSNPGKPGKVIKYEQPPNTSLVIDVPPAALGGAQRHLPQALDRRGREEGRCPGQPGRVRRSSSGGLGLEEGRLPATRLGSDPDDRARGAHPVRLGHC